MLWSLSIREMQIKTTVKYHLISGKMAIIKKSTKNKHWRRCEEKGTLSHYWWECKFIQPLWGIEWRFLEKQEFLYDPAIPLLGIYPEQMETQIWKCTCTPIFIAALFRVVKTWKQSKCPSTYDWLKKICMYNGILLSHKKNEILSFAATWMDLGLPWWLRQ